MKKIGYKSFKFGNDFLSFKVFQQFNEVGLTTWDAGFYLAEFAFSFPEYFENKKC